VTYFASRRRIKKTLSETALRTEAILFAFFLSVSRSAAAVYSG